MQETPENRLKRLQIQSWRRGTKEMDLILGTFADAELDKLSPEELNQFEALLLENDQDLYPWFTQQQVCPDEHIEMFKKIRLAEYFR